MTAGGKTVKEACVLTVTGFVRHVACVSAVTGAADSAVSGFFWGGEVVTGSPGTVVGPAGSVTLFTVDNAGAIAMVFSTADDFATVCAA